jgi:hypothetical protein
MIVLVYETYCWVPQTIIRGEKLIASKILYDIAYSSDAPASIR